MPNNKQKMIKSKKLLVYHGTGKSFNRFDLKKTTQGIIWFTSHRDNILKGETGAESSGYVLTCEVTINNPAGWDEYDRYALAQLSSEGYDGAILDELDGFVCFVFNPRQVKILKSEKISNVVHEDAENYKGVHKAPDKTSGAAPLHDLTQIYPDDIYSDKASRYYGDMGGDANDKDSARLMQQYRNKPNATVKIYRAVPIDKKDISINAGDWITINKNYAVQHGKSALYGKYKIVSKIVPARTLFTDANSIHEFGYDPTV